MGMAYAVPLPANANPVFRQNGMQYYAVPLHSQNTEDVEPGISAAERA